MASAWHRARGWMNWSSWPSPPRFPSPHAPHLWDAFSPWPWVPLTQLDRDEDRTHPLAPSCPPPPTPEEGIHGPGLSHGLAM